MKTSAKLPAQQTALILLVLTAGSANAEPIRELGGLEELTFFERTGGITPDPFVFAFDSLELAERLPDPLDFGNRDFSGASAEHYDVFYSDVDGTFNADGEYVTVECVFNQSQRGSAGNIAEVILSFSDSPDEFANQVASFATLGENADPSSVFLAIDQDLQTHARLGNTANQAARLRLTLGFLSSSGPSPLIFMDGFETGDLSAWSVPP